MIIRTTMHILPMPFSGLMFPFPLGLKVNKIRLQEKQGLAVVSCQHPVLCLDYSANIYDFFFLFARKMMCIFTSLLKVCLGSFFMFATSLSILLLSCWLLLFSVTSHFTAGYRPYLYYRQTTKSIDSTSEASFLQ